MKKTILSVLSFVLLISSSWAYDYKCSNGEVEILINLGGKIYEEFELDRLIFENNHQIMITEFTTNTKYEKFVAVTYDGAGQESFQAYQPDRLAPLKKMLDFYFEHEGAYLVGGYFSKVQNEWVDFQYEQMKCQF